MTQLPVLSPGRIVADDTASLRLTMEHLSRHVFLGGGTGQGKTMLLLLLMRQLMSQGVGFTFLTPHTGACEEMLLYAGVKQIPPSNVIYFRPGNPERALSF